MTIRIDPGHSGPQHIQNRLQPAVQLLIQAADYAADLRAHAEEFAVDARTLDQLGLLEVDLLWLTRKGYLTRTVAGAAFLTPAGQVYFCGEIRKVLQHAAEVSRPLWNPQRRELLWGAALVKRFRTPAPNQELILVAFEEEGWPDAIDDPLPRAAAVEPKRRLHDTITALNRHRETPRVRFAGDGTGTGIRWEAC